ncbi:hypothetical protein [Mycobacterium palustre]|uniref:hypothetical protein n=1 Tax=Mycobacterium palustre TaxID=153971 RepID=UPI001150CBB3|nr:hypothetical protein [Mycobacterium palustre]
MTTVVAAAAIASGQVLATSTAHADPNNCTVPAAHLDLHHSSGYDVAVKALVATLGPTATVRVNPDLTSVGNASGGINLRTVDFVITWTGTRNVVHFTGTVDNNGVAHGTSTGLTYPVKLDPGPWDSATRLACP